MQRQVTKVLAIVATIIFLGCYLKEDALEETVIQERLQSNGSNHPGVACAMTTPHVKHNALDVPKRPGAENWSFYRSPPGLEAKKDKAKVRLLALNKATAVNPSKQQERSRAAVSKVVITAKAFLPGIVVDKMVENVLSKEDVRRGVQEKVTGDIFRDRLKRLTRDCSPQDTVIIYTHSHGRKAGFEGSQPLGGIVLDLPVRRPDHRGTFLWDEYVELLLKIPAKNVVVLTMSCFSGGLVEYMNTPKVRTLWNDRKKQGRNLIVMTSQNKDSLSSPIVKDGEIINPFTYAVVKAFAGEADGFRLEHDEFTKPAPKDGNLTVGEMIDYILYTTENTLSESAMPLRKNIAKPQLTGSFNRKDVLFVRGKVARNSHEDNNPAQSDTTAEADKPCR